MAADFSWGWIADTAYSGDGQQDPRNRRGDIDEQPRSPLDPQALVSIQTEEDFLRVKRLKGGNPSPPRSLLVTNGINIYYAQTY